MGLSLTKWTRLLRRPSSSVQRIVFFVIRCTAIVRSCRLTSWSTPPIFLVSSAFLSCAVRGAIRQQRRPRPSMRFIVPPFVYLPNFPERVGPRSDALTFQRRRQGLPAERERSFLARRCPQHLLLGA